MLTLEHLTLLSRNYKDYADFVQGDHNLCIISAMPNRMPFTFTAPITLFPTPKWNKTEHVEGWSYSVLAKSSHDFAMVLGSEISARSCPSLRS